MSSTIYSTARIAGVLKSAVSRVPNKQINISPEAREKVLRTIEELQYQSSKLARALTSSGFNAIMVISARSTRTTAGNPFFSGVSHAITAKAEEKGFDVISQTLHNSAEDLQERESKVKRKMIKGIIMLSSPAGEPFFAQLDKYEVSVVVIGEVEGQYSHAYSVGTDNYGDNIVLTNALTENGHKNIAYLHTLFDVHTSVDRVNSYKQSLAIRNIVVRDKRTIDDGYTHETALKTARELLGQPPLSETVFTTNSLKLMSIYRATAEKNIVTPQQLVVVGYSNETLSFILAPTPDGTDISTQELGQQSCGLLFQLIAEKSPPQSITVVAHTSLK